MGLFRRHAGSEVAGSDPAQGDLPDFHPSTILRDWGNAKCFRISDAKSGVCIVGSTGSGKSSGPAKHLAISYLIQGFGFLVLCAKPEEIQQWRQWCSLTNRDGDIVEMTADGELCYNFLQAEAERDAKDGGGLIMNIVGLLCEVDEAISKGSGGGDDSGVEESYWPKQTKHYLTNLVSICVLSDQPVTLPRLRELGNSAPLTLEQANSESFRSKSECCKAIVKAVALHSADEYKMMDVKECATFFLSEWPQLSDKTRSIIQSKVSGIFRPLLTMPLYKIFSTKTNMRPEMAFDGAVIICNIPSQIYNEVGICVGVIMKYLMQRAVMRRSEPNDGTYLRPVCIYSDEAQNYISSYDYIYQSIARSAAGCTIYVFQNVDTMIAKLGSEHKVYSLCANLQNLFACQNTNNNTNEWVCNVLGQRWVKQVSTTSTVNSPDGEGKRGASGGASSSLIKRHYIEAAEFAQLARGGHYTGYKVECIAYIGGKAFPDPSGEEYMLPYARLTFNQR